MRAIGIILAGGNNHRMRELSQKREGSSADSVQCQIFK